MLQDDLGHVVHVDAANDVGRFVETVPLRRKGACPTSGQACQRRSNTQHDGREKAKTKTHKERAEDGAKPTTMGEDSPQQQAWSFFFSSGRAAASQ